MNIPRLIVTREHGSWAVLFAPMVIAASVARQYTLSELLFLCAALSVFMAYVPTQTILRDRLTHPQGTETVHRAEFWAALFGILALAAGIVLVARGYWLLLLVAGVGALSFFGNFLLTLYFQKSVTSDFVAVAGLALGAPGMYYVATGRLDRTAFVLWVLNALFFGSSVFYVHMKMRASSMKRSDLTVSERFTIGRLNILYHLVVLTIVGILTSTHQIPRLVMLAYVPMFIHALVGTIRLSGRVQYRTLGYVLLGHSFVFCLLLALTEHL
ncbi:MAG TPA: YwiC-like family protein [Bacteroidota bacterium]